MAQNRYPENREGNGGELLTFVVAYMLLVLFGFIAAGIYYL